MSFKVDAKKRLLSLLFVLLAVVCQQSMAMTTPGKEHITISVKNTAVADILEEIDKQTEYTFSYESTTIDKLPRVTFSASDEPLDKCLDRLCRMVGLEWKEAGKVIILRRVERTFTVNGYVFDNAGETLLSATVFDSSTRLGTATNQYGFFSIRLPEGNVSLRASYVGYNEVDNEFFLSSDTTMNIILSPNTLLSEVFVQADSLNSPLRTTQTGLTTLSSADIISMPAILSSPDLVRRLQMLPGVASGTELMAGMYVRGGNSDENLFLIDGNPLYQINHLGGLFSTFNVDAIKTVDFYKSGFPARYGGRLSSVVDLRTKDGSMNGYHGVFSIGLLEGRLQFEGPIVNGKTSFNVALRRSWLDAITAPGFALYNLSNKKDRMNFRYAYHDLNAKITHRFSDYNRLSFSVYSGYDVLKNTEDTREDNSRYKDNMNFGWGNTVASLNWNSVLNSNLFSDISLVYSQFESDISEKVYEGKNKDADNDWMNVTRSERRERTVIRDFGYRANFDYRPLSSHHIRFGSDYLFHRFVPQRNTMYNYQKLDGVVKEQSRVAKTASVTAHELSLYVEDEIDIFSWWKVNLGVRGTMFSVDRKNYFSVEPRVSTRFAIHPKVSLKVSYTDMSQYVHMLSTTYLSLPSDLWVPVTDKVAPMKSHQISAGLYFNLPLGIQADVEGYYKAMDNVLDYRNTPRLTAPYDSWEDNVTMGKGRSYGVEIGLRRTKGRTTGEIAYTLSWAERKFNEFWDGNWFPARYDSRHRFNISLSHRFNKKVELFTAWTYSTGTRVTVCLDNQYLTSSHIGSISGVYGTYDYPNNVQLPAYHRLDIGINIYKPTKRGHEGIWNISVYNAYCRMNPFKVSVKEKGLYYVYEDNVSIQDRTEVKAQGLVPIIPSFSYTLKF